jgi:hypothetical protein
LYQDQINISVFVFALEKQNNGLFKVFLVLNYLLLLLYFIFLTTFFKVVKIAKANFFLSDEKRKVSLRKSIIFMLAKK